MMRDLELLFNRPWIIWRLKMTGVVMMKTRWIHTGAHGADFLLVPSYHTKFPVPKSKETWQAILICLSKQNQTFTAGEEIRLAQIPVYRAEKASFYLSLLVGEEIRLKSLSTSC